MFLGEICNLESKSYLYLFQGACYGNSSVSLGSSSPYIIEAEQAWMSVTCSRSSNIKTELARIVNGNWKNWQRVCGKDSLTFFFTWCF